MALVALALPIAACEADRTEIVVEVRSDLTVPTGIDEVVLEVRRTGEVQTATADLRVRPLPRTLGIVHRDGPLGPLQVRAVGRLGGVDVVEQNATVSFEKGRTLLLRMFLAASCGGRCPDLSGEDLEPYPPREDGGRGADGQTGPDGDLDGSAPGDASAYEGGRTDAAPMDGGVTDAGTADAGAPRDAAVADAGTPDACVAETCNSRDDDCDGNVDEGFDFTSDPEHCGECNLACSGNHTTPTCMDALCVVTECDVDWGNCDADPMNGCETNLRNDDAHCGRCDFPCGAQRCQQGMCR